MKKFALAVLLFNVVVVGASLLALAQEPEVGAAASPLAQGIRAVGAGLAFLGGAIGTGIAQSRIGAAVMGAVAEDRANFGIGLILIAIPETLVIFGFVVIFLL
jgi:V/A-type H+-transporting ATPase subunit K